jgi:tetratricopeptide (TPR) repeat protein
MTLAELHRDSGDNKQAEALLQRAQPVVEATRDRALALQLQCMRASVHGYLGQLPQAKALLDDAWAKLRAGAPDAAAQLACHVEAANVSRNLADPAAMLEHAQAALKLIGQPRPGQLLQAITMEVWIGEAHGLRGDLAAAIAAHERAIERLHAIGRGNTGLVSTMQHNLAGYLSRAGNQLRAADALKQHLALEGPPGQPRDPSSLTNYGRMLVRIGRYDEAQPLLQQALKAYQANGNQRGEAFTRLGLATATCHRESLALCDAQLAEVTAALRGVLPAQHSVFASVRVQSGRAALEARDYPRAARELQAASDAFDAALDRTPARSQAQALLARAEQHLGHTLRARQLANDAVAAARAAMQGQPHTEWLGSALLAQGVVLAAQGETGQARAVLGEALNQLQASMGPDAWATRDARTRLGAL